MVPPAPTPSTRTLHGLLLLAATGLAPAQQPATKAREIPDSEAKLLLAEFKTEMGANTKNLAKRLAAVQKLEQVQNAMLVAPLLSTVRTDKSKVVRQAAAKALGRQPRKKARPALISLIKKTKVSADPNLLASAIQALGESCYQPRDWALLQSIFDKSITDNNAVNLQSAILDLAGTSKEIDAVDFLIEHLDAPAPEWVDDPNNPPESYWKARWANWSKWKGRVKEALFQITGQKFGSKKEAKLWVQKNRKTLRRESRSSGKDKRKK
ncbi:MAG: HEAT repeat domain-containing protein [Planctomycetes bacterium]|nr:HEAT repeat domain-containing protein [Planctomycetota bacterium]MCB9888367.1 HEAT repeat domain-containing protein [Planctomycetota bacterium]